MIDLVGSTMTEQPEQPDEQLEDTDEDESSFDEPEPAPEPAPDQQTHGDTGDGAETD
jgi:hypothetical protein